MPHDSFATRGSQLHAAVAEFPLECRPGDPTAGHTGAVVAEAAEPISTTVTLLGDSPANYVCLIASHFGTSVDDATWILQTTAASELGIDPRRVMVCSSHNHSVPLLAKHSLCGYENPAIIRSKLEMTPLGDQFLAKLRSALRTLPDRLQPVTVEWAVGHERRISYNRKGRRDDGSTYFIREEDRVLLGQDYSGDIDDDAPVVSLRGKDNRIVSAITQFTAHPVTAYHAEHLVACGEWPQVASEILAEHLDPANPPPVSFLQGCAGDINSREMFCGGVKRTREFGRMLGETYVAATRQVRISQRNDWQFSIASVDVPLADLPPPPLLVAELIEMEAFVRRAKAGDEQTLACVGLNFPKALSPAYRGRLVELLMPWNQWALERQADGSAQDVPRFLPLDVYVLRLGEVAIVGYPTEPFQNIGRQTRRLSPCPLTIPCGYTNSATGFIGYIPDSTNMGDREYMSAFYRYTRYLPPFRKPAGDVLATTAADLLASGW